MLVLNSTLVGVPIMSLQTGDSLGETAEPIIDPRKFSVVAFYTTGPRISAASVLHVADIREVGQLGFIVDSSDNIMELDNSLVRLQEVISFNFSLINKPVIDQNRRKLGRVTEYVVENEGFTIQKIHVGQSIMKNFGSSELVIGRSQIVELTDREIIVRAGTVEEKPGLMQMVNPFRKQSVASHQFENASSDVKNDGSGLDRSEIQT